MMQENNTGFTLIELLVVVLIIGILAAVALPQYQKSVAKSKYIQIQTAGESIARAETVYFLANNTYTNDLENLDLTFPQKNFSVSIDVNNKAFNIIDSQLGLGYIGYFSGTRECRVYQDKSYLHEVCKSMTGDMVGEGDSNPAVKRLYKYK